MAYKVTLNNSAGEIDNRVAVTEADIKKAVLEMIENTPHLEAGDVIKTEVID